MPVSRDDLLRISLAEAAERLVAGPGPLILLFRRGDFSVDLCAPNGTNMQRPHVVAALLRVTRVGQQTEYIVRAIEAVELYLRVQCLGLTVSPLSPKPR